MKIFIFCVCFFNLKQKYQHCLFKLKACLHAGRVLLYIYMQQESYCIFACSKSLTVCLHAERVLLYICMQQMSYCIFACSKSLTVYLHAARVLLYISTSDYFQCMSRCAANLLMQNKDLSAVAKAKLLRSFEIHQQWPRLNL